MARLLPGARDVTASRAGLLAPATILDGNTRTVFPATMRAGRRLARLIRSSPLWARMVVALLVFVLLALSITGVVGTRLLRTYMLNRTDVQLRLAAGPVVHRSLYGAQHSGFRPGDSPSRSSPLGVPASQLPSEFLVYQVSADGRDISELGTPLRNDQPPPLLPRLDTAKVASVNGRPFSVASEDHSSQQWRVLVEPLNRFEPGAGGSVVIAITLNNVTSTVDHLQQIDLIVGLAILLLLAVTSFWIVRIGLRPLEEIEQTAEAIAMGDLTRRMEVTSPRNEVGRLSVALNTMLSQIESSLTARKTSERAARQSEEMVRRFVADASHELRTPLTSIKGFSELYAQGAVTTRRDLDDLMHRISDEASRMGVLIEDLLMLARLDQQQPLAMDPVDLVVLAADAVASARILDPTRPVRLTVGRVPADSVGIESQALTNAPVASNVPGCQAEEPGVLVRGDENRLRQVVTNLVQNAMVHSPNDTPIDVVVRTEYRPPRNTPDTNESPSDVAPASSISVVPIERQIEGLAGIIEVRDFGPGIPESKAKRIFERFYRGDPSRSQGSGGTGLGLSIVAAIVDAHQGRIELETSFEAGSLFRVILSETDAAGTGPTAATATAATAATATATAATDSQETLRKS